MYSIWRLVLESIEALAWPTVAVLGLVLLRRPLVALLGLVRKVSIAQVAVEFATLPELQPSWSVGNSDVRRLSSAQIFDSASETLFEELLKPAHSEYAIVDLVTGDAWLTSRLFVFALILGEVTGLRAFVFLETASGTRRRFLGTATPTNVRRALGKRYPWLEEALVRAVNSRYAPAPPSAFTNQPAPFADLSQVKNVVRVFIEWLQRPTEPPPPERDSYLAFGGVPPTWERAARIDGRQLEEDLGDALERQWVDASPDTPRRAISNAVIRRSGQFVALVESDRRFVALVDRYALLAEICARNSEKDDNERPA